MPAADHPEPAAAPKPKRRWWQFSISSLLGLTFLVAVALAFVVNPARKQGQAVEYIESVGGSVGYSSDADDGRLLAPNWLRAAIGQRYLEKVKGIDLFNTQVSDAGLAHLKGLTALERLDLSDTQVSDAGLAHLEGLTRMRWLNLDYTRVTDAGIADLQKSLPNCRIVHGH